MGTVTTNLRDNPFGPANVVPLVDGSAATGFSLLYARQDHVHPIDTSRSPLASPAFTGVPTAPTAAPGDSTAEIATTAFVTTADNLKANIASPTLTGVPAAPTAAVGTSTAQLATTAFVAANSVAKTGDTMTGNLTASGYIVTANGGGLTANGTNAFVELGAPLSASTPFVDFHSSGNANDYDVRIIASGGAAGIGLGTLGVVAAVVTLSADLNWVGSVWTTYTPTVGALAGAVTTASASGRYKQNGKTVHFSVGVTLTNPGTASNALTVTLPVTASAAAQAAFAGREDAIVGSGLISQLQSTTVMYFQRYDGAFIGTAGMHFVISGSYEAA